jgi:hypothetical protein
MESAGFLHTFATYDELVAYVGGKPLLNRIAFLVKPKPGGKVKVRIVTNLKASKGNKFLRIPGRIVLPRIVDALELAVHILSRLEDDVIAGEAEYGEGCEWGTADIKDAFLNMPVLPEERIVQCYKIDLPNKPPRYATSIRWCSGRALLPSSGEEWPPGRVEPPKVCSILSSSCSKSTWTIPCGSSAVRPPPAGGWW